jgi:hypothetical protein
MKSGNIRVCGAIFYIPVVKKYIEHIILFIRRIVNSQFATLDQQNAQYISLEVYIKISHSMEKDGKNRLD